MSTLISQCLNYDKAALMDCLTGVTVATPSGPAVTAGLLSSCQDYDKKDLLECLTGVGDACCFVVGIEGCALLLDGEPFSIFDNG